MSQRHAKNGGWAAFDLKQKQKEIVEARASSESFPSLPSSFSSLQSSTSFSKNNHPYVKPISSVIAPYVDFTSTLGNKKSETSKVGTEVIPQRTEVYKRLKEYYSWAADGLIEDILIAVENDFEKASSFLKAMVSDESFEKSKHNAVVKSTELLSNDKRLPVKRENVGVRKEFDLHCEKLSDADMDFNAMIRQLTCVPIEPEWEEDDLYLSCRKDAINMMRAATRHSKSATNSFLRGDHFAAQQFSTKAREEWTAAKGLNEKAAGEILTTRNENNGLWKLDLHGLHATEAVQALKERLYTIETLVIRKSSSLSALPNSFRTQSTTFHASAASPRPNNMERSDEQAFSGQKRKLLEVITGIGNHSRGGAAIPTAVKTFLSDSGYRFEEARPGVIMLHPKFRH